jgi:NDP-sugar pyrophosphorylase family protein
MKVVILAGGRGTRLLPYTTVFPKPLMPIGDVPILEIVIKQLVEHGFKEINLAVGYLSELLKSYFGDGSKYGVDINYWKETEPLGTVGPLKQIPDLESSFLVMNGDTLTSLDYSKLIAYHKRQDSLVTIAMHKRQVRIDFGVMDVVDDAVIAYHEKPTIDYLVSMGIYVFEPKALDYVGCNEKLDFPDLIGRLLKDRQPIYGYLSPDYWLDIGRPEDYQKACLDYEAGKI